MRYLTLAYSLKRLARPTAYARPNQITAVRYFSVASSSVILYDENTKKLSEISSDSKVIAYFTASWCGPCRAIKPVFQKLAESNPSIRFVQIDVDENPDTAADADIRAVPTFKAYSGGKVVKEFSGANANALQSMVDSLN
jgi:thioredoxin 1